VAKDSASIPASESPGRRSTTPSKVKGGSRQQGCHSPWGEAAVPDGFKARKFRVPAPAFRSSCGARWLLCLRSSAALSANHPPTLRRSIVAISLRRDELDVPIAQPSTMTQPSALRRKHSVCAHAKPGPHTAPPIPTFS
jgi:hypothetical protein